MVRAGDGADPPDRLPLPGRNRREDLAQARPSISREDRIIEPEAVSAEVVSELAETNEGRTP